MERLGFFRIETPKTIWIDEFVCLGSKIYSFKCGDDSKNILKGISNSQSKQINFEECYNCLFGEEYQKNVIIILFELLIMKCIFKK